MGLKKLFSFTGRSELPLAPTHFSDTRKVEIELSTKCTASCRECPRTKAIKQENKEKDWDSGFLDPDTLIHFLKSQSQLNEVHFCGAYGDAIYHPKLAEICERVHTEIPFPMRISLETNGSHRTKEWWMQLAQSLRVEDSINFSVDGLGDTNAIYRIGTRWETILAGMETVRAHFDGLVNWRWILFSHNEHQVVDAYRLSKKMGINNFILVNSGRHYAGSKPTQSIFELEEAMRRATATDQAEMPAG